MLFTPVWAQSLQPASFRGIQFQVTESRVTRGRRVAIHEYPGADTVYVEDLGRSRQEFSFSGFLVGDDCYAQMTELARVCDIRGLGTLVHPSLGSQQANLISASFNEHAQDGRMVGISLRFLLAREISFAANYPLATNSLFPGLQAALNTVGAAIADFSSAIADALASINVFGVLTSLAEFAFVVGTALAFFGELVAAAANIALAPISAVRGIAIGQPNISLGRYALGNLAVAVNAPKVAPQSITATLADAVTDALTTACVARTAVANAITANAALAQSGDPAIGQSTADLVEAARTTINDPADQIHALTPLCRFQPVNSLPAISPISQGTQAVTVATGALCRRVALASLANACNAYQPKSSTEVTNIINQVTPLFDDEIASAADTGNLSSYQELRTLKTAVIGNLQAYANNLPPLMSVSSQQSLPSLVWAARLYNDATRSDELIQRVDPDNPAMMPLSFLALSA